MRFDAVYTGTLQRHVQTLAGIQDGLPGLPEATALPALNEYDSHALIRCMQAEPLGPACTPEGFKAHFRLLCDALAQWMAGVISPKACPAGRPSQTGCAIHWSRCASSTMQARCWWSAAAGRLPPPSAPYWVLPRSGDRPQHAHPKYRHHSAEHEPQASDAAKLQHPEPSGYARHPRLGDICLKA